MAPQENLKQLGDKLEGILRTRKATGLDLFLFQKRILEGAGLDPDLLDGWRFKINTRAKGRLGQCSPSAKRIEVSAWAFKVPHQAIRTLAHEMAHALVYEDWTKSASWNTPKPHGTEWKRWARRLGHPGTRVDRTQVAAVAEVSPRHKAKCVLCGRIHGVGPRQVKRLQNYRCGRCKGNLALI